MAIIIYLVGCILAIILFIIVIMKKYDYTLICIPPTLFIGLLSWLGVLFMLLSFLDEDTIIFKRKK